MHECKLLSLLLCSHVCGFFSLFTLTVQSFDHYEGIETALDELELENTSYWLF